MPTILLVFLVFLINAFIYGSNNPQNCYIGTHIYYAVMILAGRYAPRIGQRILLAFTTLANFVYVSVNPYQSRFVVVAVIYPFVALLIVRTVRNLKSERSKTEDQLRQINHTKSELEQNVQILNALFEASRSANSDLELEQLFREMVEILARTIGVHQGEIFFKSDHQPIKRIRSTFGLTESETRRTPENFVPKIEQHITNANEPIALPGGWKPTDSPLPPHMITTKNQIEIWCVPLIIDEKIIGTMLIDKASEQFSIDDDLRIFSIIASIIAQRVKIQQIIEEMVENERLATLGKMATTIAHEVRNPLGGIRGAAQLIESENDLQNMIEYVDLILREVDRLNRVIEQLLTFGRRRELKIELIEIPSLISEILELCRLDLEKSEIEVIKDWHDDFPKIETDVDGLKQILLNLIRNAIESMEEGGRLMMRLDHNENEISIRVEDNGRGIPKEIAEVIFDPFYTTKPKGTGLGLAICRQIIAEIGGKIELDLSVIDGAAFQITLMIRT